MENAECSSITSAAEVQRIINSNAQLAQEALAFRRANPNVVLPTIRRERGELVETWPQPRTREEIEAIQTAATFWVSVAISLLGAPWVGIPLGILGNNWDDFEGTFDTRGAAIDAVTGLVFAQFDLPPVVGDAVEAVFSRILEGFLDTFTQERLTERGTRRAEQVYDWHYAQRDAVDEWWHS